MLKAPWAVQDCAATSFSCGEACSELKPSGVHHGTEKSWEVKDLWQHMDQMQDCGKRADASIGPPLFAASEAGDRLAVAAGHSDHQINLPFSASTVVLKRRLVTMCFQYLVNMRTSKKDEQNDLKTHKSCR